ncbi:BQ5605_C008g05194 [Microbotryum silenes-dioicae]|uniref:BQ5605_C008g05194 protein n=1 Tax=Microbotryum silenes-dioicae TaxID=796604 RepID=A0A2X0P7Z0_9BASI|nr:BQ5605_C008g05194 [Microbotryum silenes-dioicae]
MIPVASGSGTRPPGPPINRNGSYPDAPPGISLSQAPSLRQGREGGRPGAPAGTIAGAVPVLAPVRPSRKGKEKAFDQDSINTPQHEQDDIQDKPAPRKSAVKGSSSRSDSASIAAKHKPKSGKKKVRIDVAESSDSEYSPSSNASADGDADDGEDEDADAEAEADGDGEGDESEVGSRSRRHSSGHHGQAEDLEAWDWDWADPSSLPIPGVAGRKKELKYLDEAIYNSALFDAAEQRVDLARMLLEWQALKSRQDQFESSTIAADQTLPHPTPLGPSLEHNRDEPGQPTTSDTEGPRVRRESLPPESIPSEVPIPSAAFLEKMSRWPLHPSRLLAQDVALPLKDAFHDLVAVALEDSVLLNLIRPAPSPRPPRARSAYQANAPFAVHVDPPNNLSSEQNGEIGGLDPSLKYDDSDSTGTEDEDEEEVLTSSLDDTLDQATLRNPHIPRLLHLLEQTTELLIEGMLGRVPLGPPPPMDFYQRTGAIDPVQLPRAIGWETVLDVAKGVEGISPSVIEELEQSMTTLYGPASQDPHPIQVLPPLIAPRKARLPKRRDTAPPDPSKSREQSTRPTDIASPASDEETTYRGKRQRRDSTESIEHDHKRSRQTTTTRSRSASQQAPSSGANSDRTGSHDDGVNEAREAQKFSNAERDDNDEKEVASLLSSLWVAGVRPAPA